MSIIKYNIEVCTRNIYLSKNEISRAYALLISDITEGKKYGFEYQFFRELKSRVNQTDSLLAYNNSHNKESLENDTLLLGESTRETKMHFMNSSLIATNQSSNATMNNGIISTDLKNISKAKIFDMKIISDNALSIAHIQDTTFVVDNKISIGEKLDRIISSANKDSIGHNLNHMRTFGRNNDSIMTIMDSKPIASRYHYNISQIDSLNKLYDRDIYKDSDILEDIKVMERYISNAWIDNTYIYADKNTITGGILDKIILWYGQKKDSTVDYTTKMFDGNANVEGDMLELYSFTKTQSKEMEYTLFLNTADRWGKFARLNDILLFEKTQMREIKFVNSLLVDRTGKQNVLLNNKMLFFERLGKLNPIIETKNVFAERSQINLLMNKVQYMYDIFMRNANIYNDYVYSERIGATTFIPKQTDVFDFAIVPNRNYRLDTTTFMMTKNPYLSRIPKTMKLAMMPGKVSVIKLFNTFNANVISKVIFSVKTQRDSVPFSSMNIIRAVREGHESIVFVDLKRMDSSENIATVTNKIITMLSQDIDSVIMVGLKNADNAQTQSEFMVGKFTADSKEYVDTVINLMALGWAKAEHNTNIDIEVIDADNDSINDSIVEEIMEIATGMNKKRLGEYVKTHELMEKNKDKLQAIEHGFLVRMNRIPEQKPIDIVKLQSAEWDTEWNKLCNITIESKDKYDKLKVPNDDYDYKQLIPQVYNATTGVPISPKGPINEPEVEVNLPVKHYNSKYKNLVREEIPVDLYIYKDTMLLIWIFWCKNRSLSENILGTLKDFYETENIEMTMFQEFARITQMDATKAINYVLDKCNEWIQNTISYYDPERMNQYERVMKQVRWFGEHVANELSKYILVREYESKIYDLAKVFYDSHFSISNIELNSSNHIITSNTVGHLYMTSHLQPVDGELIVEVILKDTGKLTIQIEDEIKTTVIEPGIYLENNLSNSAFIKSAIKIELPAGSYNVKMLLEGGIGNVEIVTIKATNNIFKTASMKFEAKPGTGTQAIDKILSMMYDYYELHHLDKSKGERNLWVSE